jgi:hypothetical protein
MNPASRSASTGTVSRPPAGRATGTARTVADRSRARSAGGRHCTGKGLDHRLEAACGIVVGGQKQFAQAVDLVVGLVGQPRLEMAGLGFGKSGRDPSGGGGVDPHPAGQFAGDGRRQGLLAVPRTRHQM